ncbi:hypothetical protein PVL29_017948 [Vitis rotundifolia]|uniref:Uncharacterized protein n=1 Tax=Vitis rotundifolia TaxID=103349 RepID=A0AA39DEC4_VITRO|nr:hypothetical protein PVL29_017948 [Vitis rotundifolia]
MGEEEGKTCKAAIPARDFNSDSSESDMIDFFPIPQPKRTVKVPKVMVRGNGQNGGGDDRKKQRKWEAPARFVSKKLGLVMSSVFGSRKPPEKSCSKPAKGEEKSQASLVKETGGEKGKSLKEGVMAHRRQTGSLSFPSFFCKKTGLKLFRSKIKSCVSHGRNRSVRIAKLKEAGSVNLAKVLSRRTVRRRRRRRAPKLGGGEEENEDPEGGDAELCKKRILMGGRCRPLSFSGIYIYPNAQRKGEEEEQKDDGEGEDAELCKKKSLMGGKCSPLNSSGIYIYPNSRRKGEEEEEKEDPEGADEELCKKRILMGGKCRPLNLSGIYFYPNIGREGEEEEKEKEDPEGEDAESNERREF